MSPSKKYDAVVVGLGGVGSFALRALANDSRASGGRFLGIERYDATSLIRGSDESSSRSSRTLVGAAGSSCGRTRIYRRAYFEHEHYVPWIDYSINVFQEMEQQSRVNLIQQCGTIIIEESASLASKPYDLPPYVAASQKSAEIHNVPIEYYNVNELPQRFPQFRYNPVHKMVGIYEPGGGFIRPEKTIETALRQSVPRPNNATTINILDNSIVANILNAKENGGNSKEPIELRIVQKRSDDDNNNESSTIEHHITTDCLLIAAGSWTGQLIPEWSKHLNVVRQIQTWIDTSDDATKETNMFSYHNMPGFVIATPDFPKDSPFYGVPCDSDDTTGASTWLKVGLHKQGGRNVHLNSDPCINHQSAATANEILEMKDAIAKGIHSDAWTNQESNSTDERQSQEYPNNIVDTLPCMYTMSPDKHYVIGEPDGYRNTLVVAGLSGHGFKCTPALGQMMADYCMMGNTEMSTKWRTHFCSPQRFGI